MEKDLKCFISEIDSVIYKTEYIDKDYKKLKNIWNKVKKDEQLLLLASDVVKDKFNERDMFASNCIVELMLRFPNQVNRGIYEEVVNKIYNNEDLSRIVLDGASNGGYSLLIYTLNNSKLKLTKEQKEFVYEEAMNQPYTKRTKDYNVIYSLSTKTCHGVFPYDIRYYILGNTNWSDEEKQELVKEFYSDEVQYASFVDQIENNIQNMYDEIDVYVPIDELLYLDDKEIAKLVKDKKVRNAILSETRLVSKIKILRKPNF